MVKFRSVVFLYAVLCMAHTFAAELPTTRRALSTASARRVRPFDRLSREEREVNKQDFELKQGLRALDARVARLQAETQEQRTILHQYQAQLQQLQGQPMTQDERRDNYFRDSMRALVCEPKCSFDGLEGTLSKQQKGIVGRVTYCAREKDYSLLGRVLLFGPPGTGKTRFAKALAGRVKVPFLPVNAGALTAGFSGDGALRIKAMLQCARDRSPIVVFIDEIEALGDRKTSDKSSSAENRSDTARVLWQSMENETELNKGVLFVAATNLPSHLDSAMQRRFGQRVPFNFPTLEQITIARDYHCRAVECDLVGDIVWPYETWKWRVLQTILPSLWFNISYSDVEFMVKDAVLSAKVEGSNVIAQQHVDEAWAALVERKKGEAALSEEDKRRRRETFFAVANLACTVIGLGHSIWAQNRNHALQQVALRSQQLNSEVQRAQFGVSHEHQQKILGLQETNFAFQQAQAKESAEHQQKILGLQETNFAFQQAQAKESAERQQKGLGLQETNLAFQQVQAKESAERQQKGLGLQETSVELQQASHEASQRQYNLAKLGFAQQVALNGIPLLAGLAASYMQ